MTITGPNAAIPAGLRDRAYDSAAIAGANGHAAGIMFVAPDGDVLMLRRAAGEENFPGHWSFPGGNADEGESPEQAALREAKEEMGVDADPKALRDVEKVVTPKGKCFHTFAMQVPEKFAPKLNGEHSGYAWASLDMLPRPMHPAVDSMLKTRLGMAGDMSVTDWAALREGLNVWLREGERDEIDRRSAFDKVLAGDELDAAIRETMARERGVPGAAKRTLTLALDKDTVRWKRRDGQLVVEKSHITKANVCPYRTEEIPGWDKDTGTHALGLEPGKVYQLLRDPDELRKAAPTLNGVQLLQAHKPTSADDHQPYDTVGSVGSNAEAVEEDGDLYLDNALYVNAASAIDGIEAKRKRELSAGYHYVPDMTPGNFRGTRYDGVMRDIVFNHVALVEDGRAGPDVVVGDSRENLMAGKPTRLGLMVMAATAARLSPLLAMDQKITLPADLVGTFKGLTSKNFATEKAKLLAGVRLAVDGKLRPGIAIDGSMEGLKAAVDAFEELSAGKADEPAEAAMMDTVEPVAGAGATKAFDAEGVANFLRSKGMGEDDIKAACDMFPKNGMAGDEDETDGEKAAREKREKAEKDDKQAKDKQAMDEQIKSTVGTAVDLAVKAERANQSGIRSALAEVAPWVGQIPATMAFDSAPAVYRHALGMLSFAGADKLHDDALMPVLKAQPKPGAHQAQQQNGAAVIAMDAASVDLAAKYAPGIVNISTRLV